LRGSGLIMPFLRIRPDNTSSQYHFPSPCYHGKLLRNQLIHLQNGLPVEGQALHIITGS